MGCGSSQSAQVIRSTKVVPMDDAPTDRPRPQANADRTTAEGRDVQKLFTQPSSSSSSSGKSPSPTPSRKSVKSLASTKGHSRSGMSSSKKHSGSNRSLVSLRAEEKKKRDQVGVTGSSSSLLKQKDSDRESTAWTTSQTGSTAWTTSQTGSKASMHTEDSGLGGNEYDNDKHNQKKATRNDENKDDCNRPPTPDLMIEGMPVKTATKTSNPANERHHDPLEAPDRDTSIIQRPPSRGGMAFDILVATPDTGNSRRPPSRLRQLDRRPSKEKVELSSEQLKLKLLAAEKRREKYEKENVLSKIENQKHRSTKVHSALQEFASRQTQESEGRLLQSLDKQALNREAHLKALREKLKAKEDHARKVREAKQALATSNA